MCVKTSKPVAAVTLSGRLSISSGSMIAARHSRLSFHIADLSLSAVLVKTETFEVWVPVPEVVLMATIGRVAEVGAFL